ncbi:VOC family protein [Methylocella silvestris]|uniref:VOC family protein n=1 Tax=Methylocella silvestris TaxID=199596 RepID=UPI0015E0E8B1|nr:glyoxalase/bleomycin resistance/extradiol dioxygenase family protein [Methylocella silvestris]
MTASTDVQTGPEGAEAQTCPAAEVKSGVVPYLMVEGALKAVEFYARAFGAETAAMVPPDAQGRTMHAHLYINGGSIMLSDFFPEHGCPQASAQGFNLMVQVADIDAWWKRAIDAGAESVMPVTEMFWGARYGQLRDPFGIVWALNEPLG